jgi:sugar O-acyltransferase (sialic acid O-acetyltransferase NeuD family)
MEKDIYAVFGTGGFAREVMPLVYDYASNLPSDSYEIIFVTDIHIEKGLEKINGIKVIFFNDFCMMQARKKYITIAIADSLTRSDIAKKASQAGIEFFSVNAFNSVKLFDVQLGEGAILCPFVTLTSNIKIGKFFHANLYSYVGHDCLIGDFVTFAPSVKCNGNVIIEDNVYVGTGAIIKEGKKGSPTVIGKGAKIAAGSFVTKSVSPGLTVMGSPAAPLSRNSIRGD